MKIMPKGFGKPKTPDYWIHVVYEPDREEFIPCNGSLAKAMIKARNLVRDIQPPIDVAFVIDGKADTANVESKYILAHLEPREFTSIDGTARKVPKYGKAHFK